MTQELRTPRLSLLLDEESYRQSSMNYFIFLNATGRKIGEIDLFVNFGTWELIYDIDHPEDRRKGYGKEAAQELLSDFWGSERRKHVDLVQLEILPENIASEMLARSLGAVRREVDRSVYPYILWDIHRPHPRPEAVPCASLNTASLFTNTEQIIPYRHRQLEIMTQRIKTPQLCLQQKFFGNAGQEYYQDHLDLTITLIATRQRIGRLYLGRSEPEIWGLGYYLQPEFRHKGYGEQAAKAALRFFWDSELRKQSKCVVAFIEPNDEASRRLVMSLGGTKREAIKGEEDDPDCWTIPYPRVEARAFVDYKDSDQDKPLP